jgi:tetratricopeptide (TPR) repeat protein
MPEQDSQAAAKAKAFFDKAGKVAETKNYDYAIDMYLQGLRYAPDALIEGHLPLAELALQRQNSGGKKPTMMERVKRLGGKTSLEQMLNAEYLFTKDPDHLPYAEAMLKAAVSGGYNKTAGWIANVIFQTANASKNPSAQTYILLKDAYKTLEQFDKAIAAIQRAARLRPEDGALADEFKNLSAELTMARGKYDGQGDFRKSIKDRESQQKLQAQAGVIKTEDYRVKAVEDARRKIAQNPDLPANIFKLADALSDLETDQTENDAISLLENTYKARNDFSFKRRAGVLRIKQLKRKTKKAKAALATNPDDSESKAALEQLSARLNSTELEHFRLCVENYPTDLGLKYEYALRLLRNEQYNEAIPLFQEAQKDPRRKIAALNKIGFCFSMKGWLADAIDVYNQAIESYEIKDDATGRELRYNLARAYEQQGDADKALEIYRKIAQSDFSYKDVSQRVDKLRSEKTKPNSQ